MIRLDDFLGLDINKEPEIFGIARPLWMKYSWPLLAATNSIRNAQYYIRRKILEVMSQQVIRNEISTIFI